MEGRAASYEVEYRSGAGLGLGARLGDVKHASTQPVLAGNSIGGFKLCWGKRLRLLRPC